MPRWPEWCRKVGETATHPAALNVGRKLLGYLATRRETPGVQTLVKRVTLDDGTTVEASFIGDQPQVIVYAPDGQETCELYVESGLLDLGPNIAADAHKRFDRGPPEFDDRPATLYFGDGVDCRQGEPGLNGKVRVTPVAKRLVSECLPKQGRSVESRLRDPAKKKAQAMLPASCWSGLMQRYVQAVYGGTELEYAGSAKALTVEGVTIGVDENWGLLHVGGALKFVRIDDEGNATVLGLRPRSACFAAVLALWRSMPSKTERQKHDRERVLTIALSGCVPGKQEAVVSGLPSGHRHFTDRNAWVFDEDGQRALVVLEADGVARCHLVRFSINGAGDLAASTSVLAAGAAGAIGGELLVNASSPYASAASASGFKLETAKRGCDYDFPVYAYFNDGQPELVKYSLIAKRDITSNTPECALERIYTPSASLLGLPMLSRSSDVNQILDAISPIVVVAEGYYGSGWGTVEEKRCFADDQDRLSVSRAGQVHGVSSRLELRESSREIITGDVFYYIGYQCFWEGCAVFSAYPRVKGYEASECGFNSTETTDLSYEETWGSEHYGGAVRFEPSAGSFFQDDCNNFYWQERQAPNSFTGTFQHTDYDIFGFDGTGLARVSSVASLPWGSSAAAMAERYSLNGGTGFFYRNDRTMDWGIKSASGSYTWTAERHVAWENRPGLFCKTVGELEALGWTLNDHYTVIAEQEQTVSTAHQITTVNDVFVFGEIRRRPSGWDNVTRAREAYRADSAWGAYRADGNISIETDSGAPSTDYSPGDWRLTELGIDAVWAVGLMFPDGLLGSPITSEFEDGVYAWAKFQNNPRRVVQGFSRAAADSLLSAQIRPELSIERGCSINMDRQTISGGYPKVSTPSFVGWA